MRAKILLQISWLGACVDEDESVCEEHDDAFKSKECNAGIAGFAAIHQLGASMQTITTPR